MLTQCFTGDSQNDHEDGGLSFQRVRMGQDSGRNVPFQVFINLYAENF